MNASVPSYAARAPWCDAAVTAATSPPGRASAHSAADCSIICPQLGTGTFELRRAEYSGMPSGSRFPSPPPQNFLKHSPKWNIFTVPHSTTLLLPSGCTSML